ncbi:hypothetical protein DB771_05505 [Burkholderia sp. AU29985]|nr:hypothetical protein EGY28_08600 [Burkholderia dolosa]PRE49793.1 hypothetical protein C6P87_12505 [Burkholderia sp. AU12872]PUA77909.1 hypothetical protein DB771_05505 [Burkholderia sp. AU29985]
MTAHFFRRSPEFIHELLLNYFFVIWPDRLAGRRAAKVAPCVTEPVNRGRQQTCAESTAF